MKGSEFKQLRIDLGDAIGRNLSPADMAKLCGLPPSDGIATILRWEVRGPSGPAAELLRILAMASNRYPILESSNFSIGLTSTKRTGPPEWKSFEK
jgi:hypothetical protein